ncbi:MAG TPA: hypothetical protein VMG12_26175 [Polyangiaceae bacterium]|nr:hypothetical protein [Polyangiaceae bacterium]
MKRLLLGIAGTIGSIALRSAPNASLAAVHRSDTPAAHRNGPARTARVDGSMLALE